FDILFLESNAQRVDSGKCADSVVEAMVYHSYHWYLIVQNPSQSLKPGLSLVCLSTTVLVSPELTIHVVIPHFGDTNPIGVHPSGGIRESKLLSLGMEYDFDALVAVHGSGERDHSLLTVYQ